MIAVVNASVFVGHRNENLTLTMLLETNFREAQGRTMLYVFKGWPLARNLYIGVVSTVAATKAPSLHLPVNDK